MLCYVIVMYADYQLWKGELPPYRKPHQYIKLKWLIFQFKKNIFSAASHSDLRTLCRTDAFASERTLLLRLYCYIGVHEKLQGPWPQVSRQLCLLARVNSRFF